ncbi:MAG: penicillin-binding protein 2 [Methylacidiphilales bacterium]|nr:penicillin-binding protein 2 [Candidatus Methylacidiphilales bacterium]
MARGGGVAMSDNYKIKIKHTILIVIVCTFCSLLILQLFYVLIVQRADLLSLSRKKIEKTIDLNPKRGSLLDRNGELLAASILEYELWVDPKIVLKNQISTLNLLASSLNRCDSLYSYFSREEKKGKRFIKVMSHLSTSSTLSCEKIPQGNISVEQATVIENLKLSGVKLNPVYRRYYPFKESFAQILGYMNSTSPQDGLELVLNNTLQGQQGKSWMLLDGRGNVIDATNLEEQVIHGTDVRLTLDYRLQIFAYQALQRTVETNRALRGSVVIIDPSTGEVLSLVNYPSFNPNQWTVEEVTKNYNYATRDLLEFGSVIKPFTMVALFDTNHIADNELIDVSKGSIQVKDRIFTDTEKKKILTLSEILSYSSNVGIIKLVSRMSSNELYHSFLKLSFNTPVVSDISIARGVPRNLESLLREDSVGKSSISHGYSYSLNTLKLAQLYTVFPEKGTIRPFRFLLNSENSNPIKKIEIPQAVFEKVDKMLSVVVSEGTGKKAQLSPYSVAGKTGTARMIPLGQSEYSSEMHLSSFVGYAPLYRPKLLCVVVIYQPRAGGYYASDVAAPLFREVTKYGLRLFGVKPDELSL